VTPSATATDATPTAVPVCVLPALRVSEGARQGTAGSVVTELDFTNVAKGTCTLEGFPGVSFLDGAGKQVGAPATRNPQPVTTVALPTTAHAVSALQVADASNYSTVDCRPVTAVAVRVYPPGSRAAVLVPLRPHLRVCSTISQGAGGQQSHVTPVQKATR
jgi:hypothetical protein